MGRKRRQAKEGYTVLTLTRKSGECIRIGDDIRVVIRDVRGRQVRIGIDAPSDVPIHREEIYLRIRQENSQAARPGVPDLSALQALVESVRPMVVGQ